MMLSYVIGHPGIFLGNSKLQKHENTLLNKQTKKRLFEYDFVWAAFFYTTCKKKNTV